MGQQEVEPMQNGGMALDLRGRVVDRAAAKRAVPPGSAMIGAVSRSKVAREVALVYAATCAVTTFVGQVPGRFLGAYGHLVLAATFLLLALSMARRDGKTAADYGIDLSGVLEAREDEPASFPGGLLHAIARAVPRLLSEFGVALLVALVVFPPFVALFRAWHEVDVFTFHPPPAPLDFVLGHLIAVALPEEALFRGYFQTRLHDLFQGRVRLFGVELSPAALVVQALLFALLHFLVGFSPARLAVFFPGLLFGLIRAARGGIGAAIWFHAMCNVLAEILTRGYL